MLTNWLHIALKGTQHTVKTLKPSKYFHFSGLLEKLVKMLVRFSEAKCGNS